LTYFRAYVKQLMQINKHECIIYKLVKVVYEKQLMNIQFSLVRSYELR